MSTLSEATAPAPNSPTVAARAIDAVKVYGKGDSEVRALDGVTSSSPRASSPPSWARRARASRRSCTACAGLDTLTSGQVFIGDVDRSAR